MNELVQRFITEAEEALKNRKYIDAECTRKPIGVIKTLYNY